MNMYFELTKKETGSPAGVFTLLDTLQLLIQYQELYKESMIVPYFENSYGTVTFKGFKLMYHCTVYATAVMVKTV